MLRNGVEAKTYQTPATVYTMADHAVYEIAAPAQVFGPGSENIVSVVRIAVVCVTNTDKFGTPARPDVRFPNDDVAQINFSHWILLRLIAAPVGR
jgi:hypothetical protein